MGARKSPRGVTLEGSSLWCAAASADSALMVTTPRCLGPHRLGRAYARRLAYVDNVPTTHPRRPDARVYSQSSIESTSPRTVWAKAMSICTITASVQAQTRTARQTM